MTRAAARGDSPVPIGSAIVKALKAAGPRSASALARDLKLRKADVLVACRTLADAGHIGRLGKRWAPRPSVRCDGLNQAGKRCARMAVSGSAFCTAHQPDAHAPLAGPLSHAPEETGWVAPLALKPPVLTPPTNADAPPARATEAVAPAGPREPAPACQEEAFVPEDWRAPNGRLLTDADAIEALRMFGDEEVQAFLEGRMPKAAAYRIARDRLRTFARMAGGQR